MSDAPAPPPPPAVTAEKKGHALIVAVGVKLLDDKSLKLLSEVIDQSAGDSEVTIVALDFSRVELLPSLGLGMLVQLHTKCKSRNQSLKLAALRPSVRQVLSITKLNRILDLVDSVNAAVK